MQTRLEEREVVLKEVAQLQPATMKLISRGRLDWGEDELVEAKRELQGLKKKQAADKEELHREAAAARAALVDRLDSLLNRFNEIATWSPRTNGAAGGSLEGHQ